MSGATPLVGHPDPDATLAWDEGRPIAAARFVADVHALAARIAERPGAVLNGCAQRYAFAVTLCAAALAGRASLMPPSRVPGVIERACRAWRDGEGLVAVTDRDEPLLDVPLLRLAPQAGTTRAWPPPSVDDATVAAIAFTSGSTGVPQPYRKSWGAMARSARAEAIGLGLADGGRRIAVLATVPPQHMYGLETSVMLALHNGWAFDAAQPLLPEAIAAALTRLPAPRVLVTTPAHLRALVATDVAPPPLACVVSATAPLPTALAADIERRWSTRLVEIYGCTETGQAAVRHTAGTDLWTPLPGVRIARRDDGACWADGAPVSEAAPLADDLELLDDGRFRLLGRIGDQLNVGGKRASLAGLTASLLEIDGVRDAAFWQRPVDPADVGDVVSGDARSGGGAASHDRAAARGALGERRLVAFAVAPGLARATIERALRLRIDPLFMPRPLLLVDALPRNAVGKLVAADFDRWARDRLALARERVVTESVVVAADHPMLAGHFPGDPIVPGAWLLSFALARARRALPALGLAGRVDGVASAKFLRPVRPGDVLELTLRPRGDAGVAFAFACGDATVASGVLAIGVDR